SVIQSRSRPSPELAQYFPSSVVSSAPSDNWSLSAVALSNLGEVSLVVAPVPDEAYRFSLELRPSISVRVERRGSRYTAVCRIFKWPVNEDHPVLISPTWDLPKGEWDTLNQSMDRYFKPEISHIDNTIC